MKWNILGYTALSQQLEPHSGLINELLRGAVQYYIALQATVPRLLPSMLVDARRTYGLVCKYEIYLYT